MTKREQQEQMSPFPMKAKRSAKDSGRISNTQDSSEMQKGRMRRSRALLQTMLEGYLHQPKGCLLVQSEVDHRVPLTVFQCGVINTTVQRPKRKSDRRTQQER